MYKRVKQIAPSVNVIGLTTTGSYGSSFIGDISALMDAGTLHPYPDGDLPARALTSAGERSQRPQWRPTRPWWVTESGYYTAPMRRRMLYQPGV